jgi:bifunctional DNA-binding transcriptional regulator/antitoxin component of YhaV-PrlF toxin-antitoxin module
MIKWNAKIAGNGTITVPKKYRELLGKDIGDTIRVCAPLEQA